jgi:acyl-coenzyme A thioesterase PaaI-like protein
VNHIGTVYAGSLFSLADYAGGVLFSSCFDTTRYYPILKETTIRFKRFATTDVTVEASFGPEEVERLNKEADQAGKANWVMEFELKDAEGNICCIVNGSFQLRKA